MQTIRYINLLDRASKVKTSKCYVHNNTVIYIVPKYKVSKAIGPAAKNMRRLQEKLGKRIKIIKEPKGLKDTESFVNDIVSPVKFRSLEIKNKVIIITAGSFQNKASLLGRNKKRFAELKKIIMGTFGLDLKIV